MNGNLYTIPETFVFDDCDKCLICNRTIKGHTKFWAEIVDGGEHIAKPGTADTKDGGYMGFWAVGSECSKKIPSEFLRTAHI